MTRPPLTKSTHVHIASGKSSFSNGLSTRTRLVSTIYDCCRKTVWRRPLTVEGCPFGSAGLLPQFLRLRYSVERQATIQLTSGYYAKFRYSTSVVLLHQPRQRFPRTSSQAPIGIHFRSTTGPPLRQSMRSQLMFPASTTLS